MEKCTWLLKTLSKQCLDYIASVEAIRPLCAAVLIKTFRTYKVTICAGLSQTLRLLIYMYVLLLST